MRAVDRGVGRPLAWILTRWRKLVPTRKPVAPEQVKRVLFVKLSEMGALVLAAPAFTEARRLFPDAEISLLCFDENADIAALGAGIPTDQLIRVPSEGLLGTITGLIRSVLRIRRERFDVLIDLEYFSRVSAVIAGMTAVPVRAGFHRFESEGLYCGDLYTHRVSWNPYLHISQAMVAVVRAAAAPVENIPHLKDELPPLSELPFPTFDPEPSERETVAHLLSEAGVPDDAEVLLVNPNSSDLLPLRRWPEAHFAELVLGLLRERPNSWVVLTGAAHEAQVGARILLTVTAEPALSSRCVSLIGKTSLRELFTLFHRARVLVSADSGPPHFAAMTPIRCVTLFGPETPLLYGPISERNEAVHMGLACSPCINAWNRRVSACTDNQCMQRIDAALVLSRVLAALED
jgi:ADP-heptose:LPS heptosyltransferase